jgi:hypothetical protein
LASSSGSVTATPPVAKSGLAKYIAVAGALLIAAIAFAVYHFLER